MKGSYYTYAANRWSQRRLKKTDWSTHAKDRQLLKACIKDLKKHALAEQICRTAGAKRQTSNKQDRLEIACNTRIIRTREFSQRKPQQDLRNHPWLYTWKAKIGTTCGKPSTKLRPNRTPKDHQSDRPQQRVPENPTVSLIIALPNNALWTAWQADGQSMRVTVSVRKPNKRHREHGRTTLSGLDTQHCLQAEVTKT
jgi:hypothetical protein